MESDEEFARKLQKQFDEEANMAEEQELEDATLAHTLASQSHSSFDSEDEEEEEEAEAAAGKREATRHGQHTTISPERKDKNQSTVAKHTISDDDDDDEEEEEEKEEETHQVSNQDCKSPAHCPPHQQGGGKTPQATKKRPLCKFGASCYRKNPWHLEEFYHPHLEQKGAGNAPSPKSSSTDASSADAKQRPAKKKKTSVPVTPETIMSHKSAFPSRLAGSDPFRLFLNKSYSVEETRQDPLTLVFPDLLNPQLGEVVESAQLNFMVDLDFLMSNYKAGGVEHKPLLLAYGQMEGNKNDYPSLTCTKVHLPFQYGTHHTKAMLFLYRSGFRVVIHTANLVPDDWYEKTQGFWVSPVFPELESGKPSILDGESPTRFKRDLVDYLQSYKNQDLTKWANIAKKFDFSACKVVLVGSVPGYHTGGLKDTWGHMKVRRALHHHAAQWKSSLPLVAQCSSIGSLGKDHKTWLSGELGLSLTGATNAYASIPNVSVIYPCEEDIRTSSQGWMGGSCLPYQSSTHEKQTWLTKHLHVWRSDARWRTRAMPHIKTYTRLSKDLSTAQYLLLTSANLSKAAWGCLQKQNSQLFIRSYELGVLLIPKFVTDGTDFSLGPSGTPGHLSLPYDTPLTPYPPGATPWLMNTKKSAKDVFGNTYP